MTTPAEAAVGNPSSYNYYPNKMINLCVISYENITDIKNLVQQQGLQVVWGPAERASGPLHITYTRAFVAYRANPSEYTVVIRGTNFDSLKSWLTEDFEVGTTVPFSQFVPNAPAGAVIAKATADGMNDLLSIIDPGTKMSLIDFLKTIANKGNVYVTGHSLGGTLVPPMFTYLNSVLYGGGFGKPMALWSFAGLTPGNGDFNSFFQSLYNPVFPFRIANSLDIAPLCWWNLDGIKNIYEPTYSWDFVERDLIEDLFADAAGKGYAQPAGGFTPLTGTMQKETIFDWISEALHQHHSTTYQTLVQAAYPTSS